MKAARPFFALIPCALFAVSCFATESPTNHDDNLASEPFPQTAASVALGQQAPASSPAQQVTNVAPVQQVVGEKKSTGLVLQDGTPIKLRLGRNLSSADAKVGEQVDFDVLEELKIGDVVVIPKGAVALGTVTEAQPKRRMGRTGKLDINIDYVRLATSEKAPLRAVKGGEGGGHVGAITTGIVATSIVFFPAAPLFLLVHGKDITIPKGTEVTAYINGNMNVDATKLPGATPPVSPATAAQSSGGTSPPQVSPAETLSVSIKSTPDGADISVDGKFVGSTPSSLRLAPGDHEIIVQKTGFKPWKRSMTLTLGGTINLDATLEKEP